MYIETLKKLMPLPDLESYDTYLFVGPHPDDIELGCGATAAKLAAMGKKVVFLVATDGRCGYLDPNAGAEEIIKRRKEEAIQGASSLGISDVRFLDFKDGGLYSLDELFRAMLKSFSHIKPDIIFCPDPYLMSECHTDHIKTGQAASRAFTGCSNLRVLRTLDIKEAASPKALAFYYTDRVNSVIEVSAYHSLKEQAIACHKSQFTDETLAVMNQYNLMRASHLGEQYKQGKLAEGYFAMTAAQTHCFPEINKY